MGKKKGKQKSKAAATPKDDRTLPFLQEMFPNIEKDIVSIIFEQNEYDEEKTMQQLEELSLDDGTRPALLFCDENDLLSGIEDVDLNSLDVSSTLTSTSTSPSASTSTKPIISNTSNNASKRHTLPKSTPFISTYDEYNIIPNNNHYSYSPNSNLQDTVATPLTFHSQFATSLTPSNPSSTPTTTTTTTTTKPSFTTSTTTSTGATLTSKHSQAYESEGGDSKHFLASMFPEVDSTMVALLYDENGNDVGKTVESLLSIVFMNYSGESSGAASDEEEEGEERSNEDIIGDGDEFEEVLEDISGEEDGGYDLEHMEDFQVEIPPSNTTISSENSDAVKSDFIVSLNLLAELFPDTPRTLLALELDELDGDLEKTIASCCRADPDYLRRLSGEKATPITPAKEDKPKGPSAVHSILRPSWVGAGNSHGHLLNNSTVPHAHPINNSTVVDSSSASSRPTWAGAGNPPSHLLNNAAKVKYVKPPPRPARKGKSTKSAKAKANDTAQPDAPPRRRGMDLAAKLKLKQLREKFNFVDADILEAVFVQSGYKVQATLLCLYVIYPHLREHAAAPANPSYANASGLNASPPGSPELPLSRKREKPDATLPATPTTPTHTQQPNGEKPRKTKRAKEDAGGSANREFITVSYRRKKAEPGANGTPNKKVMDSDDIENTYQSYRDQAFKNSEMRNLMFRQATAAYQAGDGHRARALHQRGREYNQMAEDSHRQACHHIFLECNARLDTLASIDLHGLHVAEALQVISTILELHAQMEPKKLRVITGQGRHSLHGIAKIKPAVKNFLRSQGYSFVEADAGVITISLNKI